MVSIDHGQQSFATQARDDHFWSRGSTVEYSGNTVDPFSVTLKPKLDEEWSSLAAALSTVRPAYSMCYGDSIEAIMASFGT